MRRPVFFCEALFAFFVCFVFLTILASTANLEAFSGGIEISIGNDPGGMGVPVPMGGADVGGVRVKVPVDAGRLVVLRGARIMLPDRTVARHCLLIDEAKGTIRAIVPEEQAEGLVARRSYWLDGLTIVPGLIDIHTHDAMSSDELSRFKASQGVTSFLATTLSAPLDELAHTLEGLRGQVGRKDVPGARMLGIHLEGPFLSVAKRGAHDEAALRAPDAQWLREHARDVRIVTYAPEVDPQGDFLRTLLDLNIVPSIGHTDATFEQVAAVLAAGAKSAAHLFNGMSGLQQRAPGCVGAMLVSNAGVCVELLADDVHVHPGLYELVRRCKGPHDVILVTDSLFASPSEAKGEPLRLADGTLAASRLTMDRAIANYRKHTGCDLREAVLAASTNPARLLGLADRKGAIAPGYDADLACLDENGAVKRTFVAGKEVYTSP